MRRAPIASLLLEGMARCVALLRGLSPMNASMPRITTRTLDTGRQCAWA